MPSRSNTGVGGGIFTNGGLPFFNVGVSSATRNVLPRSCLSPRVFLSCIMVTVTVTWLLMFSYSRISFGFRHPRDSEDWRILEDHFQEANHHPAWRWGNATLASHFTCQTVSRHTPSHHGIGYDRETLCSVQNLCVDAERGVWIHLPKTEGTGDFPWINVVAGGPGADAYFRPAVLKHFPSGVNYRYIDQTVFVYDQDFKVPSPVSPSSSLSSSSNSHDNIEGISTSSLTTDPWIMNSLLPLHSIMSTFGGSHSSWFLRVEGQNKARNSRQSQGSGQQQQQQPIDTSVLAPFGREIIMNPRAKLTGYQLNPPIKSYPTCFAKAIVGLESRCTRPYCQNIIGGNDLTESLRRTLFTQLASRMVKYQRIDQDIVHPATGADVPIVQPENITILEGESAPRSRIQVALLGRFGNTSVPNAMALELSLLARGFNVKTIHFDRPDEIPIAQAAELFKNQSILVAPQGEGLGYATWMAPGTTVISLLPRFTRSSKVYTDRMMAFGKRFFAWDCQDESCVQPDRDLAHDCIEQTEGAEGESITAQEYEDFVQMKVDFRERSLVWKRIVDCYAKDVSRRLHVEELTTLIESLAADFGTPDAAAAAQSDSSKAQISKRGAEGDENEDEDQEAGQDMDEAGKQEEEDVNALEQDDDMENDGTIRIQPGAGDGQKGKTETETEAASEQEEEDEDINFHEYDTNVPEEDEDKAEGDGDADTTAPPPLTKAAPPPPAVKTLQQADAETGRGTAGGAVATKKAWAALPITQVAVPLLTFPEFCKRGRCCGSAEGTAPVETMGTSKALTPCAASMSAIVLGPQGVWGESESTTSPSSSSPPSIVDTRGKVWQVDLDRELA